ncbi:hypothetical protein BDK51DRAFT_18999 [Blyttiomyces helicus]|uniref:Serine/threonine-protein phosphatase 2A activator n=1 Tax=Blyttiomyces helicus TaxID=388810 RepID=A0A4P9WRI8_9FUNG|nr:hypothetical protein BDK51DRAFT_18999 [Blyttiomyces helicus]|eukprot:RKO94488.1 hypothetical protein BDK51DRAFT_18999 [Blyttiomyces helicus]
MPPPGTVRPPPPGTPSPISVPRLANRRQTISIPADHVFTVPIKRIVDDASLDLWLHSEAFARLIEFMQTLNDAVRGVRNTAGGEVSETVQKTLDVLQILDGWIDEIPPLESPQRFGNKAFRLWVQRLEESSESLMTSLVPSSRASAIPELAGYFAGAFGNGTRIDYGSGHELSFLAWMCCMDLIDAFGPADHCVLLTRVFARRQTVSPLKCKPEPGNAHVIFPPCPLPSLPKVKNGPFHEHSPMLYDISGVAQWAKVNTGMLKMYVAEVLRKLPVVQHLPFGSLLPFEEAHEMGPDAGDSTVQG